MREQQGLLIEVALNFRTQRGFPRLADHDVENQSGGGDDDEEDSEQLEENAILHALLEVGAIVTWDPRNGIQRRERF